MSSEQGRARSMYLEIVLLGALLLLPLLGYPQIFEVSEGREGVVVNEILNSGQVILPLRNGEIIPSKPILFHWIGALGAKVLGQYNEFELRLPSALAAILTVVVLAAAIMKLNFPATTARFGAFILLTMLGFFKMAADGRVDMVFTLFTTAAVLVWIVARAKAGTPRIPGRVYCTIGVLCGFAVLAKGPLGLALPVLVIAAITVLEDGIRGLTKMPHPGWLLGLLIPLPWYVLAALAGEEGFVGRQIIFENIARFRGGEGITVKGPFYYLGALWGEAAPWSLLLPLYIGLLLWRPRWAELSAAAELQRGLLFERSNRGLAVRAGLIWFFVGVLFFSLSAGKRKTYLLPLLPGLALALSVAVSGGYEQLRAAGLLERFAALLGPRTKAWAFGAWIVTLGGLLIFLLAGMLESTAALFTGEAGVTIAAVPLALRNGAPGLLAYTAVWSLLALFLLRRAFSNRRPQDLLLCAAVYLLFVLTVILPLGIATKGVTHTYKQFAASVADVVDPSTKINFVKTRKDESFDGFFFYFRRHVRMIDPQTRPEEPGTYLARQRWISKQPRFWRERVTPLLVGGRRIDTPEEQLVLFKLSKGNSAERSGTGV